MNIAILSRNRHLYSTSRLVEAAEDRGHYVRVVDHGKCAVMMESAKPAIIYHGQPLEDIDAVIPRIGASVTFFGTAVVRQFEAQEIFVANPSQAIVRSRDKLRSLQLLSRRGIGVPKTAFAKFPKDKDVEELLTQIGGAPVVIKLLEGTQGLGVVLAETDKAAKSVIEAFSGLKTNILVQEYIEESKGADIRVIVIGGKALCAIKRQGKEGDFRSNLHRGGSGTVVELTDEERSVAERSAKILGLSVAGVDLLQSKKGPMVIEVNSSPGLEGAETVSQVNIAGAIIEYIEEQIAQNENESKD